VESNVLWEFRAAGFVRHTAKHPLPVVTGESASWYQGKRGFLPPAAIVSETHIRPGVGTSV
jgi:hypothetical protein